MIHANNSIQLKDNKHYEISLRFKYPNLKLLSSKEFADQRLLSLKIKLWKHPSFYKNYVEFVNDMLINTYAEEVPVCENPDKV